jgi:bacteriocin biosynthesis cyclodehydratase domain-containing protein
VIGMSLELPRLAWPFTILTGRDTVRLVAGEDFRYTLTGSGLDVWLPDWLKQLDGRTTLDDAIGQLPEDLHATARELVARLYGERVLVDGSATDVHKPVRYRLAVEGSAAWVWQPPPEDQDPTAKSLPVLCQDRLDYDEALHFNRRCLLSRTPWLWATTGPMSRAYVSPFFLPNAGPCLSCLLYHFRRLSPAPYLYDEIAKHSRSGREVVPVPFPKPAIAMVQQMLLWKAALANEELANAALYRLHVLELAGMEVTSHRVWIDPECPECSGKK